MKAICCPGRLLAYVRGLWLSARIGQPVTSPAVLDSSITVHWKTFVCFIIFNCFTTLTASQHDIFNTFIPLE